MLWGSNIQPQQSRDSRRNPWHDEYIQDGREEVETPGESDDSRSQSGIDRDAGTWGERDAGRLDTRTAAEDLHVLREELAALSRTRSQGAQSERNDGLFKTVSRKSARNDGLSRTLSRKSTRQNVPRRASMADHERRSSDAHTHDDDMGSKTDEEPGDIGAVHEGGPLREAQRRTISQESRRCLQEPHCQGCRLHGIVCSHAS
jgi:ATP-binding cassette subfamily G (WHITE) protein 2 (SNQ2)